jgi:2-oxoisovalerate dehydrogenase E1 component
LSDVLEQHPGALLFGEDVARKGGVYGITKGLHERFGSLRVFNTLLTGNDGAWLARTDVGVAEYARARVYDPDNRDLLVITYGNGVALSLAAALPLQRSHGVATRTLDLRWLSPLPEADIVAHARATRAVLVVDECRRSGNVSEAIAALLLDAGFQGRFARVTSADCFIPLGDAAEHVLVSEEAIVAAALTLVAR